MSVIPLVKLGIILAIPAPFVVRVWRNLRRPQGALSEEERRLVPLWRQQAFGIGLAVIACGVWFVLFGAPAAPNVPFWTVYALLILVGAGALIVVRAVTVEVRSTGVRDSNRLRRTVSDRYDILWKVALVGCFAAFFTSLSVTSFQSSAWLAHPLLVATYILMAVTLVLAALAGWTRNRG